VLLGVTSGFALVGAFIVAAIGLSADLNRMKGSPRGPGS
jgi:hypothetical protein